MKTRTCLCLLAALPGLGAACADILGLKNGRILTGEYAGDITGTVSLETSSGLPAVEAAQPLIK